VARYIVYTGTGLSIGEAPETPDDLWYVGEAGGYRIHLIYKPDLKWMKSDDAALTEELAQRISKSAAGKPVLIYGAQKFIGQKALTHMGVTFCQMPYSIYRILGNGDDAA
jgi:adenine-specific DNA-methyltransferase